MLRSAPNQRFQSAQEVWAALDDSAPAIPDTSLNKHQPPVISKPAPPPSTPVPNFSALELLAASAFSGMMGALISIAFLSLLKSPPITFVICAAILTGLIFAQTKRWVEKWDLVIIPAITLLIIFFYSLVTRRTCYSTNNYFICSSQLDCCCSYLIISSHIQNIIHATLTNFLNYF